MLGRGEIVTCGCFTALYTGKWEGERCRNSVSLAGRSGETPVAGKARSWRTLQATLRSLDFFFIIPFRITYDVYF